MTTGTKVALWIVGGVAVVGGGAIAYAVATDPRRHQGPSGDPMRRSIGTSVADLLDISRSAAQAYRESTSGGGGAGDSGAADTSLYDAAGGTARGDRSGTTARQGV